MYLCRLFLKNEKYEQNNEYERFVPHPDDDGSNNNW